jgi:hypothetical protein
MQRTKFKYKAVQGKVVADWTTADLKESMLAIPNGEIIIREQIEWGVDQMRSYLHGPATKFIVSQFKDKGIVVTDKWVHNFLRDEFLPVDTKQLGKKNVRIPVSSESIGRKAYIQWLNEINDWCKDAFGVALPPPEQVE